MTPELEAFRTQQKLEYYEKIVGLLHGADDPPEERWGLVIRPSHWLEDTCAVQRNAYGLEPEGVEYIKEQVTGAFVELGELLQALPWKAARDGTGEFPEPTPQQVEHAKTELIDALIFLGNIAVALEFTDQEIWDELNRKAMKNVSKRAGLGKNLWPEQTERVLIATTDPQTEAEIGRFK